MSPTRGIDFATLSLQGRARSRHPHRGRGPGALQEFADQMDAAPHTRGRALLPPHDGERGEARRATLAERRDLLFAGASCSVTRAMIFDVEAPDYDEARAFMTLRDAIHAALRSEEKAHAFFAAAIPCIADPTVRTLFEELCAEEVAHRELVRRELEKAPADPRIPTAEFADEPTGE